MGARQTFVLLVGLLMGAGAMALEKPQYTVLEQTSDYQLRQYDPYVVAATRVRASFEAAGNEGFRRLLRYISGHNQASGKIAMTAPVGQTRGETGRDPRTPGCLITLLRTLESGALRA